MFVYDNLEEHLKNIIGTKVSVNPKANGKGKIEIEYYSEEELERIYDLIMSINQNRRNRNVKRKNYRKKMKQKS